MNNPEKPFLTAASLTKSFGSTKVMDNIDLQLSAGELLAVLGPSGSGKSTLLRAIAGLVRPDSGIITCGGQTWMDESTFIAPENRDCGMVFQDMALFPHLNIGKNISFAIERKKKREVTAAMLELVGLDGLAKRMVHQLSGGQQQRAALARSLAPRPGLLLLDEPFSGLDLKLRQTMRRDVRKILKKQGVAAILVTHDQSEAFAFADTVAVVFAGKLEQRAVPQIIYQKPTTDTIAAFVGDANFISMRHALTVFPCLDRLDHLLKKPENTIMFRPEDFLLQKEPPANATIIETEFQGAWQKLLVKFDQGQQIEIYTHTLELWQEGQRLMPLPRRGCIYSPKGTLLGEIPEDIFS
ncbi:MAG: hypothetical protein CSB24_03090 [Deltaproteobacteria bacterium]|nr:MAG: hypothetical protein CSB24_03090 [Deltaproteobacteria bacterium]